MRDFEIHAAISDAIERFAERLFAELMKQAGQAPVREAEAALQRAAWAVREAGKSQRTRRREAREAEQAKRCEQAGDDKSARAAGEEKR